MSVSVAEFLMSQGVPWQTVEMFRRYHAENPGVWKSFEAFTLFAIEKGKKVGAKAVYERVRWESEIERGDDFKANNNFCSYYARIFELKYPQHAGYFEKRKVTGLSRAA